MSKKLKRQIEIVRNQITSIVQDKKICNMINDDTLIRLEIIQKNINIMYGLLNNSIGVIVNKNDIEAEISPKQWELIKREFNKLPRENIYKEDIISFIYNKLITLKNQKI